MKLTMHRCGRRAAPRSRPRVWVERMDAWLDGQSTPQTVPVAAIPAATPAPGGAPIGREATEDDGRVSES